MKIREMNLETFKFMKEEFYSGVISDILDDFGLRNQHLDPSIKPVNSQLKVAGKAMTMLSVDTYNIPERPYEMELQALDELKEGQVVVVTSNFSKRTGFWGELLTTLAMRRGCNGAVMDAYTRDTAKILKLGFPLFVTGYSPVDSKGRSEVISYNCHIELSGVPVDPGDIVFGDIDGIIIIPKDIAVEVVNKVYEKIHSENKVREELLQGKSITEVYNKYKIL
ncbi:MAG: RraA family protein [Actinobacteria bacterium]|nr:RraA family protein [Actinomycetota bacterium]